MTPRPELNEPDLSTLAHAPEDVDHGFLLHPSPALLFDSDTGRILVANVAAEELYGWSRAELGRMALAEIRPPEARPDLSVSLNTLHRGNASRWHRTRHWRRDGEPIEVEVLTQPMRLEGRPVWRAVVLDVTARVRAEDLFRGVAEQSLTGIYVIQDGRFVYMNPRLADMFGYTVEEVQALDDPFALLAPEVRALLQARSAARLQGDTTAVRYEVRARRRDGSPIDIEIFGSSLALHGRPALLGTVLDVTERVTAATTLAESERRFRAAFEQSMTGMSLTSPEGRWIRVNRALCEMLGYAEDELKSCTFQDVTHPDDLPANLVLRDALITGEVPGYRLDKRFVRRDGGIVWVALNVALVRDEQGAPLYMVAQMTDITARRRAEAALDESEARLRQSQKMEAVGRLAGGVAHDFNNLLTVIRSNAEIGADLAREGLGAPEEFSEINAAVQRAASLTRQLLAFSRQQVLAPAPVALNDVVLDAQRMLRRVIGVDVQLETSLDREVGEVVADRGQLEQVLMNLVVNARDAMPDGGRVEIRTSREADDIVALSVTDSGSGMDAATRIRAFEPFFTTKAVGKGTGLGLSTVYGIAQQSGGEVSIRSEPGAGTTVTLSLPSRGQLALSDSSPTHRVSSEQADDARGCTIMVVEDEPEVRTVVRRILERFGYKVVEAVNGADALSQWLEHGSAVRLVLSDAFMPVMGGSELAGRLRAAGADVPVLFMSGYPDGERGSGVPAGAPLIHKPFSASELRDAVVRQLAARHPAPAFPRGETPG